MSVHVHESKHFFSQIINFMAWKIPLTSTSVITYYFLLVHVSKITDDQNAQKMPVDYTDTVDIEFSVNPKDLFHGWWFYGYMYLHVKWCNHLKKKKKHAIFKGKFATHAKLSTWHFRMILKQWIK